MPVFSCGCNSALTQLNDKTVLIWLILIVVCGGRENTTGRQVIQSTKLSATLPHSQRRLPPVGRQIFPFSFITAGIKLIPIIVNHWALQASLISNLMNIKQDQLKHYCYTGLLTSRPLLPAAHLLVKTQQQQSPVMTVSISFPFVFFKQPIHLMDKSEIERYSFWPFRAPHTKQAL